MLHLFNKNLRRLCSRFRWPVRRRSKPKIIIKRFGKSNSRLQDSSNTNGSATIYPNDQKGIPKPENPIRIATFNAALFSMAPAIPPLTLDKSNFDFNENDEVLSSFSTKCSVSDGAYSSYYEEMGKPTPKVEVMKYLKNKQYTDAKDFAGECESVVIIAKGQNVQGTCKYGTRVDYILVSPDSPYKFVPGSYMVLSSKGTSDHHIVKVDVTKAEVSSQQQHVKRQRNPKSNSFQDNRF
ncbi:DNAse I-like superfamily protein [Tanacetum coccineum]